MDEFKARETARTQKILKLLKSADKPLTAEKIHTLIGATDRQLDTGLCLVRLEHACVIEKRGRSYVLSFPL